MQTQTPVDPLKTREGQRYIHWHKGQMDRLANKGCLSANGSYLDGWYSPDATCPDFLLPHEAVKYRLLMNADTN